MEDNNPAAESSKPGISSFTLHILAMEFMLCDHMWATVLPSQDWLTLVGRIAFPIFAFMIVEGYTHTRNLKRYILRILFWALLSEIPFNLMCGGSIFYPFHQNVLWTLLLGLLSIVLIEKCKARFKRVAAVLLSIGIVLLGFALGYLIMADYFGVGVLTVLVFYFFRKRNWKCLLAQIICLYILNVELIGGVDYPVNLFGHELELSQQGFALLALIPIWLYNGRQGIHSKAFQYVCYAFYPVHMLFLFILAELTFSL